MTYAQLRWHGVPEDEARLIMARRRIQAAMKRNRPKRIKPPITPRYDEVYFRGVAALEAM